MPLPSESCTLLNTINCLCTTIELQRLNISLGEKGKGKENFLNN